MKREAIHSWRWTSGLNQSGQFDKMECMPTPIQIHGNKKSKQILLIDNGLPKQISLTHNEYFHLLSSCICKFMALY